MCVLFGHHIDKDILIKREKKRKSFVVFFSSETLLMCDSISNVINDCMIEIKIKGLHKHNYVENKVKFNF